jgi:Xaa-Pro aminopeptidase
MIKKKIQRLREKFDKLDIDGYVIPKNDEFFSEYAGIDRLKFISNFSGSAGYAIILKNKNYLFVDGRYTIQAKIESGKHFKIIDFHKIFNCNLFKKLTIGLNPKLFTSDQIKKFFLKNNKIKLINSDLISQNLGRKIENKKYFFSISKNICGESHVNKINKVLNSLKKLKAESIFVSAPENVAWLLNIRGHDNPNSPIPNCHLLLDNHRKIYLIADKTKTKKLILENK